ncbi:MAG: hypothetical protein LBQ66_11935 [Planctomycetaceae bacterium]|nr:hypothetical protein [Planctomycetaceae bacterium]
MEQQGDESRVTKLDELKKQAKKIIEIGATERHVKNLVNDFKKFFREDTIKKLVPLGSSSSNQSNDEFVIPDCPDSLKCGKPVAYADMLKISRDLDGATDGECDSMYKLLKVNERAETKDILTQATKKSKDIHNMPKTDIKADPLNRLSAKFMLFFKNDDERKNYDVALKRFPFDKEANTTLTLYVDGWLAKKKTDWKQYHGCIDEVKKLGYTQEEAAYLVYEYFCITRKCPLPAKTKKGTGWGKHEKLHSHLVFLFKESIEYHKSSNPRIKNKLQSVIEQFNEIADPDSVENTLKVLMDDLRNFWDSCKYDGIVSNPLFRPTALANFPFDKLRNFLQSFTH